MLTPHQTLIIEIFIPHCAVLVRRWAMQLALEECRVDTAEYISRVFALRTLADIGGLFRTWGGPVHGGHEAWLGSWA